MPVQSTDRTLTVSYELRGDEFRFADNRSPVDFTTDSAF
jgi:hypothetical protein